MVAVEHDHPRARAEHGSLEATDRLVEAVEAHQAHERRRLAAGDDEPVEPVELLRLAHLDDVRAEPAQHRRVLAEVPLDCEDADLHRHHFACCYQPRVSSSCDGSSEAVEMPTIGSPSPAETSASTFGSLKCVVASTIAFAARLGIARLEDARADEHAVRAELHAERRVGRCRDPARGERHDGKPTVLGHPAHELVRRAQLLRLGVELLVAQRLQPADPAEDRAHVRDRVDDVARAGLALRADHRGAFGDAPERLAEVRAAADERHGELPLVDVVLEVGGSQHLRLVDVVDLERLEDLRLGEVADAALRHHRDRDRLLDRADHLRVGHARDAALDADVGGDALERHDGDRARIFGDARLLGVHDVHDHPALEHLGEARLDPHGSEVEHRGQFTRERKARRRRRR